MLKPQVEGRFAIQQLSEIGRVFFNGRNRNFTSVGQIHATLVNIKIRRLNSSSCMTHFGLIIQGVEDLFSPELTSNSMDVMVNKDDTFGSVVSLISPCSFSNPVWDDGLNW